MEKSFLEVRDGPRIVDWDAIDLMAYGKKGDAILCPLCGNRKNPENWLCYNCQLKWGNEGKIAIQIQIGIRNFRLWDRFVGENLTGSLNGSDVKSIVSKSAPVRITVESEDSAEIVDMPIEVAKPFPLVVVENDSTTKDHKEVVEAPNSSAPEVKIIKAAPKRSGLNGSRKQAPTVKWKGGGHVRLNTEELACALTEGDRAQISERKIEAFPDFWVLDDVLEVMANWSLHKRVFCPICGEYKQPDWWMCDECARRKDANVHRWLLQFEISQRNPHASFIGGNLLSPKQRESLRNQVVEFLGISFAQEYYQAPNRLIRAASSFPAVPEYKFPVASFVLGRVALEAIYLKEGGSLEKLELSAAFNRNFSVPMNSGFRGDIVGNEEGHFTEPDKGSEDFVGEVEKLLAKVDKNLNENRLLAEALFAFLLVQFETWSEERVQSGKKAPKKEFIQESNFSDAFFYNLKTKGNCSLKKAQEIAEFFDSNLKSALAIGLQKKKEDSSESIA